MATKKKATKKENFTSRGKAAKKIQGKDFVYRSSVTGLIVTEEFYLQNPETTYKDTIANNTDNGKTIVSKDGKTIPCAKN